MRTGSLRARVAVAVLGLMAVTLLVLGVFVHAVLGARLRDDLRARLQDRAALAQGLDGQLSGQQLADRLAGAGVSATVGQGSTAVTGRVTVTPPAPGAGPGPHGRPATPGAADPQPAPPPAPKAATAPVQQSGPVLYVTETLPDAGQVTLSVSEADVTDTLHRLAVVEAIGSLAVLAIVGLLLSRLVGVALRPLDRMTALARSIAQGARGGRLRPTRPTTELGRTAAAFDSMLDELEQAADQARNAEERLRQFLADASHELRTPVTGLQAAAETLLHGDGDRDEREQLALGAVRAAHRAGRLVDDLLVMARADDAAGLPLNREPVDLAAVAQDSLHRARLLGPNLDWQLLEIRPGDGHTLGDPVRIAQIVDNLLTNALRATTAGGTVQLSVSRTPDRAHTQLLVRDSGPGVRPQDRERIFERFVRLDPTRYPGTGLGLPLARVLARAHGGDVSLLDAGPGATFVLRLPCADRLRGFSPASDRATTVTTWRDHGNHRTTAGI